MTGVRFHSTWISWAMIMGPWSGARTPIREAITKSVYISPESGSLVAGKNTQLFVYYYKKEKDYFWIYHPVIVSSRTFSLVGFVRRLTTIIAIRAMTNA